MPFHDQIKCTVSKIEYDFDARKGTAYSPVDSVPDLAGSVTTFEAIDPKVKRIEHYEGKKITTVYFRKDGEWESELR